MPNPGLNRPPKRLLLVLLGLVVCVAVVRLGWSHFYPAPEVPLPNDPEALQPQLRAYIADKAKAAMDRPRVPEAHATLGIVYAANQLWPEAKRAFENATKLEPAQPLAFLYVAVATEEMGDLQQALALYRDVTVDFPEFPQGYARLGKLALQLGLVDEAESAFSRLITLTPGEWRGHAGLGEVALRRGRHEEAVDHLEAATKLDPNAGNAHSLLGLAYRALGRNEKANLSLARGLDSQQYPMPDAWGEKAHEHMRLVQDQIEMADHLSTSGQSQQAIAILSRALNYSPTNLALLNGMALALDRAGRPDQAQKVINKMLELDPRYLPGIINASFVAQKLVQTNQALAFAHRAVAQAPNSSHAHLALANTWLATEQDQEALNALQAASRCDPRNAEIHLQMGDVLLLNLQKDDEAFEQYRIACELKPSLVSAQIRRARLLLERGDIPEARKAISLIRSFQPDHPGLSLLERDQPEP